MPGTPNDGNTSRRFSEALEGGRAALRAVFDLLNGILLTYFPYLKWGIKASDIFIQKVSTINRSQPNA